MFLNCYSVTNAVTVLIDLKRELCAIFNDRSKSIFLSVLTLLFPTLQLYSVPLPLFKYVKQQVKSKVPNIALISLQLSYFRSKTKYYLHCRKFVLCFALVQITFLRAGLLWHLMWMHHLSLHEALFSVPYEDLLSFSFQTQSSHPKSPAPSCQFRLCRKNTPF